MKKFRGKIIIFPKLELRTILINVSIKSAKSIILDQERRGIDLDRGKEKIVD